MMTFQATNNPPRAPCCLAFRAGAVSPRDPGPELSHQATGAAISPLLTDDTARNHTYWASSGITACLDGFTGCSQWHWKQVACPVSNVISGAAGDSVRRWQSVQSGVRLAADCTAGVICLMAAARHVGSVGCALRCPGCENRTPKSLALLDSSP